MRILFITQWFPPEPNIKCLPFARQLIGLGHQVQVLTGLPNYPDGKIYSGYRLRLLQKEHIDGIPIVRVPLYPSHDRSAIGRFLNYTSFAFFATSIGPFVVDGADVIYVYHPPPTIFLPAYVTRLVYRTPIVYDIQDLWPDTLAASGMFSSKLGLKLVNSWCNFIYRRTDRIVVLSPGFKNILCERGVPADKIDVIYNWDDESTAPLNKPDQHLAKELGFTNYFNVVFAGNLGKAQALEAVLKAAQIIAGRHAKIRFVFVGDGVEADHLKHEARQMSLQNVRFLPRRPKSEIGAVLRIADLLLVHLQDDPLYRITIPCKTQAYLATGKPILIGVRGDAADLVLRAKAGLTCEPENPESISEAVERFYSMSQKELAAMGENGKRFYQQELSLARGVRRFEEIFESLQGNRQRAN